MKTLQQRSQSALAIRNYRNVPRLPGWSPACLWGNDSWVDACKKKISKIYSDVPHTDTHTHTGKGKSGGRRKNTKDWFGYACRDSVPKTSHHLSCFVWTVLRKKIPRTQKKTYNADKWYDISNASPNDVCWYHGSCCQATLRPHAQSPMVNVIGFEHEVEALPANAEWWMFLDVPEFVRFSQLSSHKPCAHEYTDTHTWTQTHIQSHTHRTTTNKYFSSRTVVSARLVDLTKSTKGKKNHTEKICDSLLSLKKKKQGRQLSAKWSGTAATSSTNSNTTGETRPKCNWFFLFTHRNYQG